MNTKLNTIYDILMWGMILGFVGFAGYVYDLINAAMQAL